MATHVPVTLDTPIVVKVQFENGLRKFKIPLRDLGAQVLPEKLRSLLQVPAGETVIFERYSDSAGAYVTLDSNSPQVYKTLFRAAKAKLKLRLKATVPGQENIAPPVGLSTPAQDTVTSPSASLPPARSELVSPERLQAEPVIARTPKPYAPPTVEQVEDESAQRSPVSPLAANAVDAGSKDEAPVPRAFDAPCFFQGRPSVSRNSDLAFRPKIDSLQTSWVVYCNNCNMPMEDEHYHCSICDHGDYDLCPSCVDSGIHCPGSGHWMVKRFVKNGCVVNSTTERVGPKPKAQVEHEMPGSYADEKRAPPVQPEEKVEVIDLSHDEEPTRTCNCCVQILRETEFVTCTACDDYDLCMECLVNNKHGHHPGHAFKPATEQTSLSPLADFLGNAGRNVRHSAVCDGCEKFIYGVRHKCLNCPDWDFCSECIKNSKFIHPGHRFVPIYEPLAEPLNSRNRHYGIYCDGPLCKEKANMSYIEGVRYKCAVCHDTDFCANCESHPTNRHNITHPLIKFKRPVRSVSVTTLNEDRNGKSLARVGDREPARRSTATETASITSSNAATQVQTIADVKPTEEQQTKTVTEKIEIRDLLSEPVQEKKAVCNLVSAPQPIPITKAEPSACSAALDAHFVRDTIPDGSKISTGQQFVQVWTLQNPGPATWPAGCSVRHVGGDNMLNVDNTQPLSQSELADASESNVVGRPVGPGEEVAFRVVMKAPVREGTAISYWRLKTAEGTPFGHRLWCDIQVTTPLLSQPLPVPAPAEPAESSNSPSNMTPYERFQRAKMERFRALRSAQSQVQGIRLDKTKADSERTSRLQEDTIERLRKMKLQLEEKENHTRLLEKMEREKMLRIQKVRKAAVERLLETRRKEHEAYNALQLAVSEQEKASYAELKGETAELPVNENVEKAVEKAAEVEPQLESSAMVFPQLDKESPASSTHEAVTAPESTKSEAGPATSPAEQTDEEFFEDAESVDIRSIGSEDGFMTDEEYDILDASDEELV